MEQTKSFRLIDSYYTEGTDHRQITLTDDQINFTIATVYQGWICPVQPRTNLAQVAHKKQYNDFFAKVMGWNSMYFGATLIQDTEQDFIVHRRKIAHYIGA
jgi:hypothetical protein